MEIEELDCEKIKDLIEARDNRNPNEFLIIENKRIRSFYSIKCSNIIFRKCFFTPRDTDKLFSDSYLENIVLEDCFWYDSKVQNAVFKNITMRHSVINNNVSMKNCVFDGLKFIDSLMQFFGFVNCEIKNTDFRGQEYFFLQSCHLSFLEELFYSGKLSQLSTIIKQCPDMFSIAWYNMKYTNCIIDLDTIRKLASYSDKLDPNFSWLAYASCRTGYINLKNADEATRYSLIAGTFLYDAHQEYDYSGKLEYKDYEEYRISGRKYLPPLFSSSDKIDLSKYRKTLSTKEKKNTMTILDNEGREIDYSLIVPLGDIEFTNSFYKDSDFVESHFDAGQLNEKYSDGDKAYQKSLWR